MIAQSAPEAPRFEVVSIKRNTTESLGSSIGETPGGGWRMINGSVAGILYSAFPVPNRDIVGLPGWASTERYDVVGTAGGGSTRQDEAAKLRALLADRFQFSGHIEQRELSVFALVIAQPDRPLAAALQRLPVDCAALDAARRRGDTPSVEPLPNGEQPCGYSMHGEGAQIVLTSRGMTMSRLVATLSGAAGRVIVDRTGLSGDYAFTLTYDLPRTGGSIGDAPTVFTALPEQLGLKLAATRAPVDTLVIDHIERPTEN